MNSRERVSTSLQHKEPDRVPFNLKVDPPILQRFKESFGDIDFSDHFRHDLRIVGYALPKAPPGVPASEWTPMPTPESMQTAAAETAALHERGLSVFGAYNMGVYEQAKDWMGDEATMVAPYESPAEFEKTLDRITEWKGCLYSAYASIGVDIVHMGDDLGTQRSLVMSPKLYREWYRPRHERIVKKIRSVRPDARIAFHCCGHVTPLIPDLIELGIDILEAVQAETMDIAFLKREFGRDISFWGAVGAQSVLARKTPEEVIEGVRKTLEIMAPGGGYLVAPCHILTEEVPWESIVAFHQAVERYGRY